MVEGGTVSDIWFDDVMNRRQDADLIQEFLKYQTDIRAKEDRGYALNIDSGWGHGKTFFLRKLKHQLSSTGHIAVYVNGWLDDSSSDPMISVIAEIDNELSPILDKDKGIKEFWSKAKRASGEISLSVAKGIAKRALSKVVGDEVDNIIDKYNNANIANIFTESTGGDADGESEISKDFSDSIVEIADSYIKEKISDHNQKIFSMKKFKISVSKLLNRHKESGGNLPMFVIVDELDRCRPTYSISMLESIKHLFDIPNVAFVIATESKQLSKSVKAVYGNEFDSDTYLKRFFDRSYRLENPSKYEFVSHALKVREIDAKKFVFPFRLSFISEISVAANIFDLSLRDIEQCIDAIGIFQRMWRHEALINGPFLLVLIILQHRGMDQLMTEIEHGSIQSLKILEHWTLLEEVGPTGRTVSHGMADLINEIARLSNLSFQRIFEAKYPERAHLAWVRDFIASEEAKEHGNKMPSNGFSILRRYPTYVRRLANII